VVYRGTNKIICGGRMISIIIPLYNEEDNIHLYKNELLEVSRKIAKSFNETVEFIFVDDGSVDHTWDKISEFVTEQDVIVSRHDRNMGLGKALRTGFSLANGDIIITIDADLTFQPIDIKELLEVYYKTNADCVSGSPYLRSGLMEEVTPFRLFMSKVANSMCKIVLLNNNISCVSPIFRLYETPVLKKLSLTSNNFEINAEIISKLLISDYTVVEAPVMLLRRRYGISKINIFREIKNYFVLFYRIIRMKYLGMGWD